MSSRVIASLGGGVFTALWLIAVFAIGGTDTPDADATAAEVRAFYDAHTVQQGVAALVLAASVPFLLAFAAQLVRARTTGDGRPVARWLTTGGSALAGAATLLVATVHFALADGGDQGVSGTALQALNLVDNDFWVAFNPALGVMMLGAAGLLIPAAARSAWLGWSALVLGVALFVPFADFFAMLLTGAWLIVAGIALAREAVAEPGPAPVPQAA